EDVRAEMTESGAQLFARLEARRCLKDIEPRLFPEDGGPNHGEVVELYGAEGTGKTEMLYHLLCRCVLPVASGGLEVDVVFVDTDYSLDMLRLVSILDNRLNSDEAVLRSCLSRLLVVHCSSSAQLLLTLHFLETTLSSRPGLALLLIDSISAFYWLDRSEGGASFSRQEERLSKCAELLGRLLRYLVFRIQVLMIHQTVLRSHSGPPSSSESDRPFLCRPWQRLVTHRLVCSSRQEAPNNNNNNMAAAAGSSEEPRTRQVFTVHATAAASSSTTSSSTASSSSPRTKTYRSSSFYVTDGGVEFI
uniref:RecA family profile 1 domain-containing protein n=1 Tax=Labrus bergylta TaxID=56723 RepID=A0A3Q3GJF7_9LABR